MRYVGHVAHIGRRRNVCKILVGPYWRPRHIWKVDIKMDLYL